MFRKVKGSKEEARKNAVKRLCTLGASLVRLESYSAATGVFMLIYDIQNGLDLASIPDRLHEIGVHISAA